MTVLINIDNSLLIYSKLPPIISVILLQSGAIATKLPIRRAEAQRRAPIVATSRYLRERFKEKLK